MTRPLLIALNSKVPGSGKSTVVAQRLIDHHGFRPLKFAAPLKDMVRTLLTTHCGIHPDLVERYVDGDLKELVIPELGVTSRHLQQKLGDEWGRKQIRHDLWVHLVSQSISRLHAKGHDVVIDDLRYPNEYTMTMEMLGTPVRVVRPAAVYQGLQHASEGQLDHMIMREVMNDGTIAQCHERVDALVADLRCA